MVDLNETNVPFSTLGFFAFSLVHNLANQLTQLLFQVDEARSFLPPKQQKELDLTTQYFCSLVQNSQDLLVQESSCPLWFDVRESILEALELSSFDLRHFHILATHELAPGFLMGNRAIFLQVLLNLLKNSMRATRSSSVRKIHIHLEKTSHAFLLTVQDTGTGLDQEQEKSSAYSQNHHGLGLSYVRYSLKHAFEGTFSLENNHETPGCTATLLLPHRDHAIIRQMHERPVE